MVKFQNNTPMFAMQNLNEIQWPFKKPILIPSL